MRGDVRSQLMVLAYLQATGARGIVDEKTGETFEIAAQPAEIAALLLRCDQARAVRILRKLARGREVSRHA